MIKAHTSKLSKHRASSKLKIPDQSLHNIKEDNKISIKYLKSLWNSAFLLGNIENFYTKLVSLNKAHPSVPKVVDMRPIRINLESFYSSLNHALLAF